MSEDLKFPNAIAVNRNLIAMLMDALVEEGALSPEARDRIIEDTLEAITPHPNEIVMNTSEEFVSGVFEKGNELGLTGGAKPPAPPAPPAKPVCPSCGWDITPGHKFCVECGIPLS